MLDVGELGPIISRSILIVISVLRSHFDDVGARPRVCQRAVFSMKGVLGRRSFRRAEGEESIVEMKEVG